MYSVQKYEHNLQKFTIYILFLIYLFTLLVGISNFFVWNNQALLHFCCIDTGLKIEKECMYST